MWMLSATHNGQMCSVLTGANTAWYDRVVFGKEQIETKFPEWLEIGGTAEGSFHRIPQDSAIYINKVYRIYPCQAMGIHTEYAVLYAAVNM